MKTFNPRDHVCSRVAGYYMGIPEIIVRKAQMQWSLDTRYVIELDIDRQITLPASKIDYYRYPQEKSN